MTGHETAMAIVLPSELRGITLNIRQNEYGKFTDSEERNVIFPLDDSHIGMGASLRESESIIPLLKDFFIDTKTGEIKFRDDREISKEIYGNESIIREDDRIQIANTKIWPWSVYGALFSTFPNGKMTLGTGTIINSHHVVTAGHNVYHPKLGGWAIGCKFIPGLSVALGIDAEDQIPFGEVNGVRLVSVKGWTENLLRSYDYAMVILDRDIGEKTGWFGIAHLKEEILLQHIVNVPGYPADKGGYSLYTHYEKINSVSDQQIGYRIDTFSGNSGSAVFVYQSPYIKKPTVLGIHNYGFLEGEVEENTATRINEDVFNNLTQWMKQW